MGDPMLKIEKFCDEDRAPPKSQKSENKFRVIRLSMRKDSHCRYSQNGPFQGNSENRNNE